MKGSLTRQEDEDVAGHVLAVDVGSCLHRRSHIIRSGPLQIVDLYPHNIPKTSQQPQEGHSMACNTAALTSAPAALACLS